MNEIGGYFQLELKNSGQHLFDEEGVYLLNSGRHALEFILRGLDHIEKIYVPAYTCDVVMEPVLKLQIPVEFYSVTKDLEVAKEVFSRIKENEYLLINNYFGLKSEYLNKVTRNFPDLISRIIVDASQSLYYRNENYRYSFFSFPKFIGVPDGGAAHLRNSKEDYKTLYESLETAISYDRFLHLIKRIDLGAQAGYEDFRENMEALSSVSLKKMSRLTKNIVESVDFEEIRMKRRKNYLLFERELKDRNQLSLSLEEEDVPLTYPFLVASGEELQKMLIESKVYVPTYWPEVASKDSLQADEKIIIKNTVFLPVDQRLKTEDIEYIINKILAYVG